MSSLAAVRPPRLTSTRNTERLPPSAPSRLTAHETSATDDFNRIDIFTCRYGCAGPSENDHVRSRAAPSSERWWLRFVLARGCNDVITSDPESLSSCNVHRGTLVRAVFRLGPLVLGPRDWSGKPASSTNVSSNDSLATVIHGGLLARWAILSPRTNVARSHVAAIIRTEPRLLLICFQMPSHKEVSLSAGESNLGILLY